MNINFRSLFFLASLASVAMLGGTYFFEYYFKLDPCPLCFLQRYVLWSITFVFWAGAFHNCRSFGRVFYSFLVLFLSLIGILLASRHLWLQYFSSEMVSSCTAGFEQMLAFNPLLDVLKEILSAPQECTRIDFTLLKLSLPAWSLFGFIGFAVFAAFMGWLTIKKEKKLN